MSTKTVEDEVVDRPMPYRRRERRMERDENPAPTPENGASNEDNSVVEGHVKSAPKENIKETTFEKRYNDLRTFSDDKIRRLTEEKNALLSKIKDKTQGEGLELPATEEEVASFASKYPDFWRVLVSFVTKATEERTSLTEAQLETLREKQRETEKKEAYLKILEAHPDFKTMDNDETFHEFLEEKPRYQKYFYEYNTDAEAAIDALDLFKAWKQKKYPPTVKESKTERKPKADPAGAEFVDTRSKVLPEGNPQEQKVWRTSEIKRLRAHEFEKYEKEIELARRDGRIIRDSI